MSAKDRLDTYERDWERHERWREPKRGFVADAGNPGGKYIEKSSYGGGAPFVRFSEMPSELRDRVAERLEFAIRQLVDAEHALVLAERRAEALEEAKRTLAALGNGEPSPRTLQAKAPP